MRYERPAIEARFETRALLVTPISGGGGDSQPVWRFEKAGGDEPRRASGVPVTQGQPTRYERPAIEARFETRALLMKTISGGAGDLQPRWRSERAREDRED